MSYIYLTQVKSIIGSPPKVVRIVKGLGLGKIGKQKKYRDTPAIRGQINRISHLVRYEFKQD